MRIKRGAADAGLFRDVADPDAAVRLAANQLDKCDIDIVAGALDAAVLFCIATELRDRCRFPFRKYASCVISVVRRRLAL